MPPGCFCPGQANRDDDAEASRSKRQQLRLSAPRRLWHARGQQSALLPATDVRTANHEDCSSTPRPTQIGPLPTSYSHTAERRTRRLQVCGSASQRAVGWSWWSRMSVRMTAVQRSPCGRRRSRPTRPVSVYGVTVQCPRTRCPPVRCPMSGCGRPASRVGVRAFRIRCVCAGDFVGARRVRRSATRSGGAPGLAACRIPRTARPSA
jgi:hypothetical protein